MPYENGNHHIYGVSLVELNMCLLNKENFAAVKKKTIVLYGLYVFQQFENWINDRSEEIEKKVNTRLYSCMKWFIKEHPDIEEKKLERVQERKHTEIIQAYKIILSAFNGSRFDNQFIFKSENILFELITYYFGLIQIVLKGSCVEFRDMMRMTVSAKLKSLCKDYKLLPDYSKTDFPHKFPCKNHLDYIGPVPGAEYWEG